MAHRHHAPFSAPVNFEFRVIGEPLPAPRPRQLSTVAYDSNVHFHRADVRRAEKETARLKYRHEQAGIDGPAPVRTFTFPKRRAFAPNFTRRALRDVRRATGFKSPTKAAVAFLVLNKLPVTWKDTARMVQKAVAQKAAKAQAA